MKPTFENYDRYVARNCRRGVQKHAKFDLN